MSWPKPKKRCIVSSAVMGRKFADRLAHGIMMDRTRLQRDGKARTVIAAPTALVKFVTPTYDERSTP